MGINNIIKPSDVLGFDTNIFIYAYQTTKSVESQAANRLLESFKKASPKAFISTLVFEEFLIKIYKLGFEKNLAEYENFLTAGGMITVVDINRAIAKMAAKLRATYPSLRTPDAIHLASAIESGCSLFISSDKRLPKKIGKLKIQTLGSEYLN